MTSVAPRVHGVLVTFNRPAALMDSLTRIAEQDLQLDSLIVVDNGTSPESQDVLGSSPCPVELVSPGENLGPAGGIALGMSRILEHAAPADWIVLFDDDDPPPTPATLSRVKRLGEQLSRDDPSVSAVGLYGARFDRRRTRLIASPTLVGDGPVAVDYLASGWFPFYRVSALKDVGVFDARLFFGFDDLELGLRLREAGYTLWAERDDAAHHQAPAAIATANPVAQAPWRRYYGTRNLIYLARRYVGVRASVQVAVAYGILAPLLAIVRREPGCLERMRLSLVAIRHGLAARLGRVVPPG